ncbi:MAG: GNAT family N-acetyltransferase [Eubacteriaceae bacterium]|nr:GNAT family N-acetyltransferase [Eubacteriaceae bacterium]MDD4507831.1 GNAT family N-acetyltransferase [Eubacteriaceae bacterium]
MEKKEILIRPSKKSDHQRILDILNMSIAERRVTALLTPVTLDKRRQWFKEHDDGLHLIYVAEYKEKVIGWMAITAYRSGREGFAHACELSYYIDQACQGQGVGTKMMDYVIKESREKGLKNLMLVIFADNNPSLRLAHRFGFRIWGRFPEIVEIDGRTTDCYQLGLKL